MTDARGTPGYSGRAIAILLIAGTCAIAALTVRWDRTRTKVGAFYAIAYRLGGLAPVGLSNKGNTAHYRVAFQGPQIFAVRRMTSRGGPLPLFETDDAWAWFLSPDTVCLGCEDTVLYGAVMTYEDDAITRVDFRDFGGRAAQHYTVRREGSTYTLTHSRPSPDRGLLHETHRYDDFDRLISLHHDGGAIRFVRDERGRVVEEVTEGEAPSTVRYTYGEPRHPARPTEVTSTRPDAYGCHSVQTDWDSIGHPVQIRCRDAHGAPVISTAGCASFDLLWDGENWTTACLDPAGKPTTAVAGWTFLRVVMDEMAYPAGVVWLGADGEEIAVGDGASRVHIERNDRGKVQKVTRYAPNGQVL